MTNKTKMMLDFDSIANEFASLNGVGYELSKADYTAMTDKMREVLGSDHIEKSVIYGRQYVALYGPCGGLLRNTPFVVN